MAPRKIIGVIGSGYIGRHPFDKDAWSGSSRFFFNECRRQGVLERAFGVEAGGPRKYFRMLRNFSPDRDRWARGFHLDPGYYRLLTGEIRKNISAGDENHDFLQIGAIYNTAQCAAPPSRCYLYTDGNLAQLLKSPFFRYGFSERRLQRTFDYEQNVYSDMNKIFTMSDFLRNSFINDFSVPAAKVFKIGAGINLDSIPEKRNKDFSRKELLFIGVDFERKGGLVLAEAFKSVRAAHPEAVLHVVGPARIPAALATAAGVHFHGRLDKSRAKDLHTLQGLFASASLFVMPSLYEPFGIAPLEAMVNQVPCILTDQWAFPELVVPGVNGDLVECGNAGSLAEKINHHLGSPDALAAMGENARRFVLENHSWEHVVNTLRNVLAADQGQEEHLR